MNQDTEPLVVAYHQDSKDSLTKYDLGVLSVRLTGLYLLTQALTHAAYIPGALGYTGARGQQWAILAMYSGPAVVDALGGTFLLTCTNWIVRRAFPEFSAGASVSASGRDLQAIAFSVVGVWLVASAVPDVAQFVAMCWSIGIPATASKRLDLIPVVAKILVQIAAGVYLFARAKGLSALWHRLRYAGIAQPPATTNRDGRPE